MEDQTSFWFQPDKQMDGMQRRLQLCQSNLRWSYISFQVEVWRLLFVYSSKLVRHRTPPDDLHDSDRQAQLHFLFFGDLDGPTRFRSESSGLSLTILMIRKQIYSKLHKIRWRQENVKKKREGENKRRWKQQRMQCKHACEHALLTGVIFEFIFHSPASLYSNLFDLNRLNKHH